MAEGGPVQGAPEDGMGAIARVWRFSLRYALPYWHWYLAGVVFLFLTNWLSVKIPVTMADAIDAMRAGDQPEVIQRAVLLIAAMGLGVILVRTLSRVLFFTPGRLVEFHLKNDLFAQLTRLQPGFYAAWETGDLVSRASNDITYLRAMVGFGGLQIFNIVLALGLTGGEMFTLSPTLTGFVLLPVLSGLGIMQFGVVRLHKLMRKAQQELSHLSSNLLSTLQGVRTVQGFVAEEAFQRRFVGRNEAYRATNLKMIGIRSTIFPLLGLAGSMGIWLLLAIGGPMVDRGEVTVGELVAFVTFVAYLLWPLMSVGWLISVFQRGLTSLERIDEVLYAVPERPEGDAPAQLPPGSPAIEISELSFTWPGEDEPALVDLSTRIEAGSMVGIYGRTGAGKSTLLALLTRAHNPPEGSVRVDGVDLRTLDLDAWRQRMAVVPQKPFLFSESIRSNVRMGDPDPEGVERAVQLAQLSDDLGSLPRGLETVVGERGIMLSGGQRQRTALARALYRSFDLLVLDDVLSAVDQETEARLVDTLESLANPAGERPTVLVVSHRLSVLARTDKVLVLDEGRLVAEGRHEDLLLQPGPYREAWEAQQAADDAQQEAG